MQPINDGVDADRNAARTGFVIRDVFGRTIWTGDAATMQAAVRIAGRSVSLAMADLSGLDLEGVDLAGVDLRGASLAGADLDGALLAGANLAGAVLDGASLRGAHLEFASLERASLAGADVIGARFDPEDAPSGYLVGSDGRLEPDETTRAALEDAERARDMEAAARLARLRELLAVRVRTSSADGRETAADGLAPDERELLGVLVCGFLRSVASPEFVVAMAGGDGDFVVAAAARADSNIRGWIERVSNRDRDREMALALAPGEGD